jgi:hypothetical protein
MYEENFNSLFYRCIFELWNKRFTVVGTTLTDDEVIIASSLKQFALFLTAMETEMSLILEHANQKFIQPLDKFGKEHIGQFNTLFTS